ncbi:hypothetical protein L3Q65_22985 [Amycolatopsis sp. FU40]|uniref:hypothetical protein n=1 Tax=Amycolatopsis sp. FU40 TaxID=2914159 RepID=UPI001F1670A5|nr:hypothetical protein [Amycolatopsis sp. FU40]UKD59464.1 hypothetical protein L3Q65_22985 [Amycolatopsis sp. FU40]
MADEWFEYGGDLGETERRFVEALRIRAAQWRASPLDSRADPPGAELPLVASLDLSDPVAGCVLLTLGVHLDGRTLRGDQVHDQLFTLPDEPTGLAFAATGDPEELAARAADWFEAVLRRPVVRCEWTLTRCVYLFADTGEIVGAGAGSVRLASLTGWPPPAASTAGAGSTPGDSGSRTS